MVRMKAQGIVQAFPQHPLRLASRVILPRGYEHLCCVGICGIIVVLMRISLLLQAAPIA